MLARAKPETEVNIYVSENELETLHVAIRGAADNRTCCGVPIIQ